MQELEIQSANLSVRYLGIPLLANKLKSTDFGDLLDKINNRLDSRSSKFLSTSRRLELIKIVIYPVIQYWMRIYLIPKVILHKIDRLCANFLKS